MKYITAKLTFFAILLLCACGQDPQPPQQYQQSSQPQSTQNQSPQYIQALPQPATVQASPTPAPIIINQQPSGGGSGDAVLAGMAAGALTHMALNNMSNGNRYSDNRTTVIHKTVVVQAPPRVPAYHPNYAPIAPRSFATSSAPRKMVSSSIRLTRASGLRFSRH